MSGLEIALIILIVIWTILLLLIGAFLVLLFWQAKKGLDKVNKILENAENITGNIATPLSKAIAGVFYLKDAFKSVIKNKRK